MKTSITVYLFRFVTSLALFSAMEVTAAYVNSDGRGQALVYPYYTAQAVGGNPYNSFISVVNRTAGSKVVRVRFREGRNAREVAAFNLYLAGGDTWTGAVVPTSAGARVVTADQSCTNGPFVSDGGASPIRHYDFSNTAYTGAFADGLGDGLDRTREGYVEMIEMAGLTGASDRAVRPTDSNATVPSNCSAVQGTSPSIETSIPTGGLSGTLTVINVAAGMDFTVNAVAIADLTSRPFYRNFDDPYPDFNSAEVDSVSQFTTQGKTYRIAVSSGLDAVAVALMAKSIGNETILDSATRSGTDWIITLPLRRLQRPNPSRVPTTYPPVSTDGIDTVFTWAPRDGGTVVLTPSCAGACFPAEFEAPTRLPWASTVWTFQRGSSAAAQFSPSSIVLGSSNAVLLTLPTSAEDGSGSLDFNQATIIPFTGTSIRISDGAITSEIGNIGGAPVVGFMVRTFQNGTLNCGGAVCQGNYGGSFPHTSER